MATYTVTLVNWNDPAFWSGISTVNGDTLDMTALAGFTISYDRTTGVLTFNDGTTTFTVGSAGATGTDATVGSGFVHNFDTLLTADGADYFDMGTDPQSINAGAGDDEIHAGGGNDTVDGGTGNDYLADGDGNDSMIGGAGNDIFEAGTGNDTLIGGDGDDLFVLSGNWGSDTIFGDNTASSATGSNNDILDFNAATSPINVTFTGWEDGTATSGGNSVTFDNIESIRATSLNDTIDASTDGSGLYLDASDGADAVIGGSGADVIKGGSGADTLSGGDGADSIDGGTGSDNITSGNGADFVAGGSGRDTIDSGAGNDTIYGDEADVGRDAGTLNTFDFSTISATGDSGAGSIGAYAIYDNIGVTSDGTVVQARLTIVGSDDPNIDVTFTTNGVSLNGDAASAVGTGVKLQFEFFDQATGLPIQLDSAFTFIDIDTTAESVSVNSGDVDSVALSGGATPTSLTVSDTGEQLTVNSNNENVAATDETHWAQFAFSDQQTLTFEVTTRGALTNYWFTDQGFTETPVVTASTPESQDDSIDAGDGDDLIYGGAGNDTILYGDGLDTVYGGNGNDSIDDIGGSATNTSSTIYGEAGNDTVYGTAAGDYIDGGADNDALYGEVGDDILIGGDGDDAVYGAEGADTLYSGAGNDLLDGGHDGDVFLVEDGSGTDTIVGGESVTTGRDFDIVDLSLLTTSGSVDFTGFEAGAVTDGTDTISFSQIEAIVGSNQADTLDATLDGTFNAMNLAIDGGAGDDSVISYGTDGSGNANVDTIYGGAGNDTISSGGGDDQVHGGDGDDLISSGYANDGAGDTVWGGAGNDTINSIEGSTGLNSSVGDHVDGGTGNDSITGTDDTAGLYQGDTLIGGEGDDTIDGLAGDDLIYGDLRSSSTLTYYVDDTGNLYQLNHATGGTQTLLQSGLQSYGDIATGADGLLYGVTATNTPGSTTSGIYRIDPATGTETLVGDIPNAAETYSSITFDSQGRIYIADDATGELRLFEFDDINGYVQTGVAGTLQPNTQDLLFIDQDTAWAVANGRIYSYDVAADGTFSNETDLGEIVPGQTDIVGLQLSEFGAVVALEASGEGHYTYSLTTPSWTSTGYVAAHSGSITGAAAYQDQGFGVTGNDLINGGDGNDTIFSGEGNDTVYGGAGNDYIDDRNGAIPSGDNFLDGGSGNDTIYGGNGDTTIYGGTGADLLDGEGGADIFINGDAFGNDTVFGGESAGTSTDNDTLSFADMTLSGVTVILTGAEAGTATAGGDTLTFSQIEAFVLTNQSDTWDASAVVTGWTVDMLGGDDNITSGAGNDSIDGGADSDTFILQDGWGQDTIAGGEGITTGIDFDTLTFLGVTTSVTVTYTGDEAGFVTDGTNTVTFTGIERIILTTSADTVDASLDTAGVSIETADGNDSILGGSGDDSITNWGGYDTVLGGDGNDTLRGSGWYEGGAGNDLIDFTAGGGPGAGNFNIGDGGAGNDTLIGADLQNDWFFLSDGVDTIDGGTQEAGFRDWISGEHLTEGFYADMQAGTATWGLGNITTFSNIEGADGSDFNDTIDGSTADDSMTGGLGNDSLSGLDGNDTLEGQEGDDTLSGGAGADSLLGGDGADILTGGAGTDTLDGGADGDKFLLTGVDIGDQVIGGETATTGTDNDTLSGAGFTATGIEVNFTADEDGFYGDGTNVGSFTGIEHLELSNLDDTVDASASTTGKTIDALDGNDSVIATTGADSIDGGAGNDTLRGGIGNDTIIGGTGDDSIAGNEDDDSLFGGDGSDSLYGELGNDFVSGGAGDDTVEGNEGDDTLYGGDGNDWLRGSYDNDILYGGAGDDYLWGGWGDDTFVIENGFGNDTVDAEGVAETNGDTLDLSAVTDALTIDLTHIDPEIGTVTDGTDTLSFNEIETIVLGSGRDTLILADGSGLDQVSGFNLTDSGDGTTVDQLDVSGLTDLNGAPVNTGDVVVSDDGAGNAVLTFPNGEALTLLGVAPAAVSSPAVLAAMGIPAPDYVIDGTAGADSIDASYIGDPDGDMVDNSDAADASQDDVVNAGAGNDTVITGTGDDSVLGGTGDDSLVGGTGADTLAGEDGDDTFVLQDGFGNDSLIGGEAGETNGDTLDLTALTTATTIDLTSATPEAGTVSDGSDTATFAEMENILLGGGRDTIVLADGSGADTVTGFDLTDSGDGTTNDQLDVSGLTSDGTTPVHANDVTVTDDGSGNAVLTFPGGESLTLVGVAPAQLSTLDSLVAMGLPDARDLIVTGTAGDDTIDASYLGDPEGDRVDGLDSLGTDNDSIVAGAGNDSIVAGAGNDTVRADEGDDTVLGGDGDDFLYGFDGSDSIDGGAGNDLINTRTAPGGAIPDVAYPGFYTADADPTHDRDTAIGGDGNDTILTGDDGDLVYGDAGADEINSGVDDDTVHGGTGNDTIYADEGNDWVDGGADDDLIYGDGTDTITGPLNIADDTDLAPDNGQDTLYGGDGNDTIFGMDDADLIYGDAGNDSLDGGIDNDSVFGGSGTDTVLGGAGSDTLDGGADADSIDGGADADLIVLTDGFGADTIHGGETTTYGTDNDTLDGSALSAPLTVTYSGAEAGTASDGTDTATFDGIENLVLTSGNDSVDGTADTAGLNVTAGDFADTIDGGTGADTIDAGTGNDVVTGGDGNDSVIAGDGNDNVSGDAGDDTLIGGTGNDILDGGLGNDSLDGGADNDILTGGDGDDTLIGDTGDDYLTGGAGADSLDAGAGNDTIYAGSGDTVTGGDGDDSFFVGPSDVNGTALTITGGEGGETLGDTLNITGPATINMTGAEAGTVTWVDGTVLTFSEIENVNYVPCFTPGTRIKTARGEIDVAEITVGDCILTRDNGYQPVRWTGTKSLTGSQLRNDPTLQPIRIQANAFGPGLPERDMLVSPQHRVALTGARVQLLTGEDEVLAAAGSLTQNPRVRQVSPGKGVTYVHFMFDRHELVMSDGTWTESFQPGDLSLAGLDAPQRAELLRLFPELTFQRGLEAYAAARTTLRGYQARLLAEA